MTIWKYPIPIADSFSLDMPSGAEALAVQVQHGQPCIWAAVDPKAEIIKVKFVLHGTGHHVSDDAGHYIGSFQVDGGNLVFHLFEAIE